MKHRGTIRRINLDQSDVIRKLITCLVSDVDKCIMQAVVPFLGALNVDSVMVLDTYKRYAKEGSVTLIRRSMSSRRIR